MTKESFQMKPFRVLMSVQVLDKNIYRNTLKLHEFH